jgi:hypothetical protein
MRFSILAAAFMATVAAAEYTSTTSTTLIETITSCGPEVTNCPGKTHTKTSTSYPVYANTSTPCTTSTSAPYVAPTKSVTLGTSYITTCIPTVITSVYTVTPSPKPSATGGLTYAHNVTTPAATATPTQYLTGSGASSVQGSVVVAAVAGLAAFLFA